MECNICKRDFDPAEQPRYWEGQIEGEDKCICQHCLEDHITEDDEPIGGLYCSFCFEDIEDPKGIWFWNRSENRCVCDKCIAKGDLW